MRLLRLHAGMSDIVQL